MHEKISQKYFTSYSNNARIEAKRYPKSIHTGFMARHCQRGKFGRPDEAYIPIVSGWKNFVALVLGKTVFTITLHYHCNSEFVIAVHYHYSTSKHVARKETCRCSLAALAKAESKLGKCNIRVWKN